ncbi:hypothetical protein HanIR_Chr13g0642131 [Helianthus annuus]|nr:hypothetical protein HanIR_Chr13g0642131 [Helianthus annuus]
MAHKGHFSPNQHHNVLNQDRIGKNWLRTDMKHCAELGNNPILWNWIVVKLEAKQLKPGFKLVEPDPLTFFNPISTKSVSDIC